MAALSLVQARLFLVSSFNHLIQASLNIKRAQILDICPTQVLKPKDQTRPEVDLARDGLVYEHPYLELRSEVIDYGSNLVEGLGIDTEAGQCSLEKMVRG